MFVRIARLITAVLTLAIGLVAFSQGELWHGSPAAAQSALLDPTTLLPGGSELPAGFVYRPLPQESTEESRLRLALRAFERTSTTGGPSHPTRLIASAAVAVDSATATSFLNSFRAQLEGRGWSFQRADGLIGDEAIVGRIGLSGTGSTAAERVMVAFRKGSATGSADWEDYANQPNRDTALSFARIIEGHIVSAGLDKLAEPVSPTIRPGIAPSDAGSASSSAPGATATATPRATMTPTPGTKTVVIRQMP